MRILPGDDYEDTVGAEAEALYPFNVETSVSLIIALRSAYRAGAEREGQAALKEQDD